MKMATYQEDFLYIYIIVLTLDLVLSTNVHENILFKRPDLRSVLQLCDA